MAELAAMTVVLNLVSQGIWEAAKAGARAARKKRGAAPPREEQRRRDSLHGHMAVALGRSASNIAEWSPEWTALQQALLAESQKQPRLIERLVFGRQFARDSLLRSKWREAAHVDPRQYDELLEELIEAARWAISQDQELAHFFQLFRAPLEPAAPVPPTDPTTRFAVPFMRNRSFVGREDDLARLHEMLRDGKPVGVAGLTGIGGIGKTQLAIEYAYKYEEFYPGGVFWANAADGLFDGMAECARYAGLSEEGVDPSSVDVKRTLVERLYRWLQKNPNSLLILDNLADPGRMNDLLFSNLVLSALKCQMLFSTRSQAFDEAQFASHQLNVLPRDASLKLLLGETRKAALAGDHPEHAAANGICHMLGDLALAIVQAGAYLSKWPQVKLDGYWDRLDREGRIETADDTPLRDRDLATRHRIGVRVVLQDSVRQLDPNGNALRVLRVLAEFGENEMVPRTTLTLASGLSHEMRGGRADELSIAADQLSSVSLVGGVRGDRLRLHPLVREFARSLTSEEERSAWSESIAASVAARLDDVAYLEGRLTREGLRPLLTDARTLSPWLAPDHDLLRLLETFSPASLGTTLYVRTMRGSPAPAGHVLQQLLNCSTLLELDAVAQQSAYLLSQRPGTHYLKLVRADPVPSQTVSATLERRREAYGISRISRSAFSADGARLAARSLFGGHLTVWELSSGRVLTALDAGPRVWLDALSLEAMTEAVASVDGLIEVRGVLRGERKCVWRAWDRRDELPRSLAFSARATWLAVGLSTGVVVIWEVGTQAQVARFSEYVSPAGALAFSDQDRYLASAPYAGGLVIRECQSWRVVSRPDAPGGPVYVMVFSRDGTMLCASTGEAVVAWEVATGKMTGLMVPAKGIASVAFSPDGRQVACGCYDKALRVWDVATGQETAEYPTAWPLGAVWWSHDGRIIKAADLGGGTDRPHVYELELAKGATELAEVGATVA